MKKLGILTVFSVFAAVLTLMPDVASAVTGGGAGESAITDMMKLVTGNIGTAIGLGIALFGLYMWLVQQTSWGIMVIIGGVAITAFPGIFDNMRAGLVTAVSNSTDVKVKANDAVN